MALNWNRWRERDSNRPLAKARIEYVVCRDDLVNAAAQAIADLLPYEPERDAISGIAKRLTRTKVEKTLTDMLTSYGGIWIDGDSTGYMMVTYDVIPLILDYADRRVTALWPDLV